MYINVALIGTIYNEVSTIMEIAGSDLAQDKSRSMPRRLIQSSTCAELQPIREVSKLIGRGNS